MRCLKSEPIYILENFGLDDLCKFFVYHMPEIDHICLHWNNYKEEAVFDVDGRSYVALLIGEL